MTSGQKKIAFGLGIPAILALTGLTWKFLAVAVPSHAADGEKEMRLKNVERLAEELGQRAQEDDTEEATTIKLCNSGAITRCAECRAVGIEIEECGR